MLTSDLPDLVEDSSSSLLLPPSPTSAIDIDAEVDA
jgi:hypothetical protein